MKKTLLVLLALLTLWFFMGRSSGYMYQNVGNEPGMPFWAQGLRLGPTVDLARD